MVCRDFDRMLTIEFKIVKAFNARMASGIHYSVKIDMKLGVVSKKWKRV